MFARVPSKLEWKISFCCKILASNINDCRIHSRLVISCSLSIESILSVEASKLEFLTVGTGKNSKKHQRNVFFSGVVILQMSADVQWRIIQRSSIGWSSKEFFEIQWRLSIGETLWQSTCFDCYFCYVELLFRLLICLLRLTAFAVYFIQVQWVTKVFRLFAIALGRGSAAAASMLTKRNLNFRFSRISWTGD